jgi:hypothetical protein
MARMKRASNLAFALLLLLAAAPARAGGLALGWNDCLNNGAGNSVQGFACNTELGSHLLYCSLVAPQPVDSVLGVRIVIDLQMDSASMPDWWRVDPGGCRDGALQADVNFGALPTCRNMWLNTPSGGFESYTVGMPRGGANQARLELSFAVPSNQALSLNDVDMYYVARVVLSDASTTLCTGCSTSTCLVLNQITLLRPPRPPGAPSADVVITNPFQGTSSWAGWQAMSAGSCQSVPVRNSTWGAVKSLYR